MLNIGDQSDSRMDTFPLMLAGLGEGEQIGLKLKAVCCRRDPVVILVHALHLMVDGSLHLVNNGNAVDAMCRNANETYINLT